MIPDEKDLDLLDAVYLEAAEVAAEEDKDLPEVRAGAERMRLHIEKRLAEMRRNQLPAALPLEVGIPIRPSLLAKSRDALLALLDDLIDRGGGAVQVAHRHRSGLSDNDLRRLIQTLDPNGE
jgi:hypothetical protein